MSMQSRNEFEVIDLLLDCQPGEVARNAVVSQCGRFVGLSLKNQPVARIYHLASHEKNAYENLRLSSDVWAMAFRPNHAEVALAIDRHVIERVAVGLGKFNSLRFNNVQAAAYSRDGRLLAGGNAAGAIRVWALDRERPEQQGEFAIGTQFITSIEFGYGNLIMFAITASGHCLQIDMSDERSKSQVKVRRILTEHDGVPDTWQCLSFAAHPWLPIAIFAGSDGTFWTYDYKLNTFWPSETSAGQAIHRVVFLPEVKKLALFGDKNVELRSVSGITFRNRQMVGSRTELLGRGTWVPTENERLISPPADKAQGVTAMPVDKHVMIAWAATESTSSRRILAD